MTSDFLRRLDAEDEKNAARAAREWAALGPLRRLAPWPAVLRPAGFEWSGGDLWTLNGQKWRIFDADGKSTIRKVTGEPILWTPTCDLAYTRLHYGGDQAAAAADLIAAATGQGTASHIARGLPSDVLGSIALAVQELDRLQDDQDEDQDREPLTASDSTVSAPASVPAERRPAASALALAEPAPPPPDFPVQLAPPAGVATRAGGPRLRVLTREDLDQLPARPELVQGLLPAEGVAVIAGRRGLGKSLLALDLLACVSLGLPYLDRSVKRVPVLSLSLEGFSGIPERVRAWETVHGHRLNDILWVRDGPFEGTTLTRRPSRVVPTATARGPRGSSSRPIQ